MTDFIKAGVIGHPIAHSKSPLIHQYWMNRYGVNGSYQAIDIAPDNLESGVQRLIDQGYAGFNVTIPHKQNIIQLCHEVDDLAEQVGAVNMVTIRNGLLYGSNTDVFGFLENLKLAVARFGFSWGMENGPALILGAGGAARAAITGLIQDHVPEIWVANRTYEKAQTLEEFGRGVVKAIKWEDKSNYAAKSNLVVNTTSLGMLGQAELDINLSQCADETLIYDIVYNPLYTPLLKQAREFDLRVVTGIGMLLYQAVPAFEEWFDAFPEVDEALEEMILS